MSRRLWSSTKKKMETPNNNENNNNSNNKKARWKHANTQFCNPFVHTYIYSISSTHLLNPVKANL